MNRMSKLAVAAVSVLLGGAYSESNVFAQNANDAVGTWTLVSAITEQGGNKTDTFGAGTKGVMSLDAGGHYVITIIGAIPKFTSNNRATGTAEENKAVVGKSIAHFGTYSINQADKTITFKMDKVTFPNWDGTEQKRPLTLSGDELKYIVATGSGGGVGTVTWKRVK